MKYAISISADFEITTEVFRWIDSYADKSLSYCHWKLSDCLYSPGNPVQRDIIITAAGRLETMLLLKYSSILHKLLPGKNGSDYNVSSMWVSCVDYCEGDIVYYNDDNCSYVCTNANQTWKLLP